MTSPPRKSGILLHPTSLPGPHGSGDLGPSAFHFVDWLAASGQSLWQLLPLTGLGPGNSPYSSPSAFAGNELLIDLESLLEAGWLGDADLAEAPAFPEQRIDYAAVRDFRMERLRRAARGFFTAAKSPAHAAFTAFCRQSQAWLDDYALFMALDVTHRGDGETLWQDWPAPLAHRQADALRAAKHEHTDEINFWKFCQWLFASQWAKLKGYANEHGVEIVGDLPIFVAGHSADVWANPGLFDLDKNGHPRVVAGVPPDYFSATGQRWGNPLYLWSAHAGQGYRWWIERMRQTLTLCDIVRIDHFRGFEAYWEIPAAAETAVDGTWQPGPGNALFAAMRKELADENGELKIIAEDLGIITPPVRKLRQDVGLPGMRILQFAFGDDARNPYLPHNYDANTVVYTGTHDNDTTCGWWEALDQEQKDRVHAYLGVGSETSEELCWYLIRLAFSSVARFCVIPMQDALALDTSHRMNQPSIGEGSWEWRYRWDQVQPWHAERLADLTKLYGRDYDSQHHPDDD